MQSNIHKDQKLSECMTLLLRDVVLTTYTMEAIDNHLKNIVSTRMNAYSRSGNLENFWEDLIFMIYMLHFKTILKCNS
jgi:hypothetical protein